MASSQARSSQCLLDSWGGSSIRGRSVHISGQSTTSLSLASCSPRESKLQAPIVGAHELVSLPPCSMFYEAPRPTTNVNRDGAPQSSLEGGSVARCWEEGIVSSSKWGKSELAGGGEACLISDCNFYLEDKAIPVVRAPQTLLGWWAYSAGRSCVSPP